MACVCGRDLEATARSLRGVESEKEELGWLTSRLQKSIQVRRPQLHFVSGGRGYDRVIEGYCASNVLLHMRHRPKVCFQELSQEKQRTLELLGVKEQEEKDTPARAAGGEQGDTGDADLLKDLQHIEEEMKVLLKEKEQAEEK